MKRDVSGHYLRRTSRRSVPRHVIVFDTETEYKEEGDTQYHTMRLAWSVYADLSKEARPEYERWRYWKKRIPLCEYIQDMANLKGEIFVVGNNIFFDLQASYFFQYFTEQGWTLDFIYEKSLTYILVIKKGRSTIKIVSLTNYLEASVESLGRLIGKHKMAVDFGNVTDDLLSIYCFRDTEITYESFLLYVQFIYDNDLGRFSLSRASQAMQSFRHRFMSIKIYHHSEPDIIALEEAAYFGGRTEAFILGKISKGPFIDLDINSMYPHIMRSMKMPIKCFDYHISPRVSDLSDMMMQYGAVAEVELDTDSPIYPVRTKDKVVFPIGKFTTSLCTESIKIALLRGHIKRVNKAAIYDMGYPFTEYVDFFYNLRMEAKLNGNDIIQRMCKLFLNSLYGKFAQRKPIILSEEDISFDGYERTQIADDVTDEYITITKLLNKIIITSGSEIMARSVIAIPAHVTDYGRCMLWNIIDGSGIKPILYCDTDSVKLRERDMLKIGYPIDDVKLGYLKVEAKYSRLHIYGLKDYKTDIVTRMKGIPKRAVLNADGSFTYNQFLRQSSHLRLKEQKRYMVKTVNKTLSREYTKGFINPDGTISPYVLPHDARFLR